MFSLEPSSLLFPVGSTVLISFLLTGLAAWYARKSGLLDHPGERHSHTMVTPRGGGAGLVGAFLIASLLWTGPEASRAWLSGILPGAVIIASVGAWDDHQSLSVRFRLFVQLAVSVGFVGYAAGVGWVQGVIPMILSGFFLVWMTNMYNFMDGSNGMAALQGVFGGVVLAWLFYLSGDGYFSALSLFLAASCIGFLPWNLGHARVFMGDVGSLALGFVFAALLLYGVGTGSFTVPVALLVMLLFLTDSSLTLTARVIRGEQWYNPHRQHLYQRLIAHGWTHGHVAVIYQVINMVLILPGIVLAIKFPVFASFTALASITICALGWYFSMRQFEGPVEAG
jgi:Fuc2NAc and GlcNAc transferase